MRAHAAGTILTVLLAASTACTPAADEGEPAAQVAVSTEADAAAIDALRGEFATALSAGDMDGIMANYGAESIQMPPNEPILIGSDAIRARHQGQQDIYDLALENPAEEILVAGDWAILRGSYVISGTPKGDAEPLEDTGKYLVTFSRSADGSWDVMHETWNSDNPLPEGGS